MSDDHVGLPIIKKRSILVKVSGHHKDNCKDWVSGKSPWSCNAHHILPLTCFKKHNVECSPADKKDYIMRCLWVSEWDINGGNRFKFPKGDNNMVRLPLFSAYHKTYPTSKTGKFNKAKYPINECMHNSRYSEHHRYIKEVKVWLAQNIWDALQENKAAHKSKGKSVLNLLQKGEKYFRSELVKRGNRETENGNKGTIDCWKNKKTDVGWPITFSMAADKKMKTKKYCTKY